MSGRSTSCRGVAQHERTLRAANNYADSLNVLKHFKEAKALMRKTVPVARRIFEESNETALKIRWSYAVALYKDTSATLDDLREAEATLEDTERIARRVFGSAYPLTAGIEHVLRTARAVRRARETPLPGRA